MQPQHLVTDKSVIAYLDSRGEHGMAMHVQLLSNIADKNRLRELYLERSVKSLSERLAAYEPPEPAQRDDVVGGRRCPADSDG